VTSRDSSQPKGNEPLILAAMPNNAEHIAAMHKSPEAMAASKAVRDLCAEMLAGAYEVAAHIRVHEEETGGQGRTRRNTGCSRSRGCALIIALLKAVAFGRSDNRG
jgi:hypothetical protein